jgi:DNA gyrase inhibitor GyrI
MPRERRFVRHEAVEALSEFVRSDSQLGSLPACHGEIKAAAGNLAQPSEFSFAEEFRAMRKSIIAGAAVAGAAAIGGAVIYYLREKATPGPGYRTIASDDDYEIRDYPAIVVAETVVSGPRKQALGDGFRRLADYIFAKSRPGEELPMTVPVLQDSGDPLASDPPLFDDDLADGAWRVRFVMPEGRSVGDLPAPPEEIELVELPPRKVGVVQFSGVADDDRLADAEDRLRGWMSRQGHPTESEPEYAFYNSPMIPPPLRRNEVLLPIG